MPTTTCDRKAASAGIHFAAVLDRLGIVVKLATRVRTFPNGATAMAALARATSENPIGSTQATEILSTPGVDLVADLPQGLDLVTTYTAAVTTSAANPGPAAAFIAALAAAAASPAGRALGFA